MDRKEQLKNLIRLNLKASDQAQNSVSSLQNELAAIEKAERKNPSKKLLQLQKQLRQNPENRALRDEITRLAIDESLGYFAVWRGGCNKFSSSSLQISQPLFISENVLHEAPVVQQAFDAMYVESLEDLCRVLPWQPTGLVTLPTQSFHPFREYEFSASAVTASSPSYFIAQPLYDTQIIWRTGTAQVNFFQVPLGGTSLDGGVGFNRPKTQLETNMDQGGSLPYPKQFRITGLSLFPEATVSAEDCAKLMETAWIRLFIGNQDYLVLPALMMVGNVTVKNPLISFKSADPCLPVYNLPVPIDLLPQQNFRVEINFPMTQSFEKNFSVRAVLHGGFTRVRYQTENKVESTDGSW